MRLSGRQSAVLSALVAAGGPMTSGDLARVTPPRNLSQTVCELRQKGFEIPCTRVNRIDRFGERCRCGVYCLTCADRSKALSVLRDQ